MTKIKKPKGDSYYNKTAENYDRKRAKQEWWHVEQREMKSLLEGLPRNLNVVDIPFGTGRFVEYYHELDHKVSGLDASHEMLAAAKKSLGDAYEKCVCVTGDASRLPYGDGQFDLLVSTRFLRDIIVFPTAKKMLAEMARVTSRYAIIQLGENPYGNEFPTDQEVMGSRLSRQAVEELLASVKLRPIERRWVNESDGGDIYHVLCEKMKSP